MPDDVMVSQRMIRRCANCGKSWGGSEMGEVDPCLGMLPGVDNACCGHGDASEAYIRFISGVVVKGFITIEHYGPRFDPPLLQRQLEHQAKTIIDLQRQLQEITEAARHYLVVWDDPDQYPDDEDLIPARDALRALVPDDDEGRSVW